MIPGLNVDAERKPFEHFNFPEELATVDTNNWKFTYSTNDLKIVQFTNVPQFTKDQDELIRKFAKESHPKTTKDWEKLSKSINKTAVACRFRYYGPLNGK
eukprot:NODE_146_length_17563_cov_0.253321.p12 type:complete len:100 gc:universal NODE_146_length_17563_cov_0.253321:9357-9656(+)